MKRIDWKFCIILTGVALAWSVVSSLGSETHLGRMISRLLSGLVDAIVNTQFLRLLMVFGAMAICLIFLLTFAFAVSRFWNHLVRRFSSKIIDLNIAEAYATILILPLLIGYIF